MDIEKRNRMVRTFCARHKHDRPLPERSFLKSRKLYVDDKLKFIYCHMPKIASTTWLELLMPLNDGYKKNNKIHVESHALSLADYTTKQALHRVRTYFKFVFVREPFERLLSGYKDKLLSKNTRYYSIVYAARTAAKTRGGNSSEQKTGTGTSGMAAVSFPELVQYLSSKSQRELKGMWDSVTNDCQPCLMNYDFIGHYETLGRDARYVLERLGIQKTFPAWKPGDTKRNAKDYYEQLSKEERKIIYEITKDDNEMFGYTPW